MPTERTLLSSWQAAVRRLKLEVYALYFAARHPRTPWYAKLMALVVVAYALSPLDLIPDFVPVLGYLDDLLLLPLGIALALRLTPRAVLAECRTQARAALPDAARPGRAAVVGVVLIWLALLAGIGLLFWRRFVR